MHYLHFEEYSNRLELPVNYIEIEGRGFKPQKGQLFFFLFFLFNIIYVSLWSLMEEKSLI
jgi:hypothetical protein